MKAFVVQQYVLSGISFVLTTMLMCLHCQVLCSILKQFCSYAGDVLLLKTTCFTENIAFWKLCKRHSSFDTAIHKHACDDLHAYIHTRSHTHTQTQTHTHTHHHTKQRLSKRESKQKQKQNKTKGNVQRSIDICVTHPSVRIPIADLPVLTLFSVIDCDCIA